jgi:hypothetical protein
MMENWKIKLPSDIGDQPMPTNLNGTSYRQFLNGLAEIFPGE